mmetsp:Transcript_21270/g.29261  ORF Transcript_21270/g.29261 Transcript_21270/m.29261 type:complete len:152 (-) Transcript_21270:38-493(-)
MIWKALLKIAWVMMLWSKHDWFESMVALVDTDTLTLVLVQMLMKRFLVSMEWIYWVVRSMLNLLVDLQLLHQSEGGQSRTHETMEMSEEVETAETIPLEENLHHHPILPDTVGTGGWIIEDVDRKDRQTSWTSIADNTLIVCVISNSRTDN